MVMGGEAPHDRKMATLALELIHAAKTGQFPYPGALRDQPRRMAGLFQHVSVILLAADYAQLHASLAMSQQPRVAGIGVSHGGDDAARHRNQRASGRRWSGGSKRIIGPSG